MDLGRLSLDELLDIPVTVGTRDLNKKLSDSSIPIQVFSAEELAATGFTDLSLALQRLLPSLGRTHPSTTDGSDHTPPLTLGGLGPDQLLVLINGKRRHSSALLHVNNTVGRGTSGTDLDTIPMAAVDRIEVLRGAAAAQYGTDAIVGILNIILKQETETVVTTTAGQTTQGDGGNAIAMAAYGTSLAHSGFIHVASRIGYQDFTNRAAADPRQQYFTGDPRNNDPAVVRSRDGDPRKKEASLVFNLSVPLGESANVYSVGTFNDRSSNASALFRRAQDKNTVRAIYPDGFLPLITPKLRDASLTCGGNGEIANWHWDACATWGKNDFQFNVEHSLNASMGTASPTSFNCGTLHYSQFTTNVDLSKAISLGSHPPLHVGLGLEHREERYGIDAGEPASYLYGGVLILDGPDIGKLTYPGAQSFPGFQPEHATRRGRHSDALYLDLENQLLTRLFLEVAGRYERYSDFGSALNGKLAARINLPLGFSLRGSTSGGFRAPSLTQSYFSSAATNLVSGLFYEIRTLPVDHPLSRALGATDLKAEDSRHTSLGLTARPTEDLFFSVDYNHVKVNDRVVLTGNITKDPAQYGPVIANLVQSYGWGGVRFFTNAIDTKTEGMEYLARYKSHWGKDETLDLSAAFQTNTTRITSNLRTPPLLAAYGNSLFNRMERARIERAQPHDVGILSATYQRQALKGGIKIIHYGSVLDVEDAAWPQYDTILRGRWMADLELSWTIKKSFTVSLGGQNIFNSYPQHRPTMLSSPLVGVVNLYHFYSPFGYNGASYYLRMTFSLR